MGRGKGRRSLELIAASLEILREGKLRRDVNTDRRVESAITERLDRETWDRYEHAEQVERESIVATVSASRDLAAVEPGA